MEEYYRRERLFFRSPCGDFHCGIGGFRKDSFARMDIRSTGMEFASEMVVKASLLRMKVSEIPASLSPDGRDRPPHLRTWRDGWRHLRFSMRFLGVIPGYSTVSSAGLKVWRECAIHISSYSW